MFLNGAKCFLWCCFILQKWTRRKNLPSRQRRRRHAAVTDNELQTTVYKLSEEIIVTFEERVWACWKYTDHTRKTFPRFSLFKYRSLQTEEIGLQHHHVMRRCRFFQALNNSETVLFKMSVFFPTHVLRMEMLWCMDFFGREWISIKVQYQVYSAECSCLDRVELWRNGKTDGSHKQPWTARLTSENRLRLGESGQIQSWQHTSDWLHSLTSYLEECTEPYTKKTVTLCCFAIG